jgi:hypothetical protein
MLKALRALALACAESGFGDAPLGPAEADALAKLEQPPAPFPGFATSLREIAAGQLPSIPSGLPRELEQLLEETIRGLRERS